MIEFNMNWNKIYDKFDISLIFDVIIMIIINKYFTEISGNCILFSFVFWIIETTRMIFYTTLYVVLFITTLKLCEFLFHARGTIAKNATGYVAGGHVDSAVAMAGHGQVVTKREIFLSRATTTNNFVGMAACAAILSYVVDSGGNIVLSHDLSCEPASCLAELSIFFIVLCLFLFVSQCGLECSLLVFFVCSPFLLLHVFCFVLLSCRDISQQAPNFDFARNAPCGNSCF